MSARLAQVRRAGGAGTARKPRSADRRAAIRGALATAGGGGPARGRAPHRGARVAADELAAALDAATGEEDALLVDWAFMSAVVDAAGNLVFQPIMNSVRELYMPRLAAFTRVVARRRQLVPLYARAAEAIGARDGRLPPPGAVRADGLRQLSRLASRARRSTGDPRDDLGPRTRSRSEVDGLSSAEDRARRRPPDARRGRRSPRGSRRRRAVRRRWLSRPGALGVNPQLTIMALATRLALRVAER